MMDRFFFKKSPAPKQPTTQAPPQETITKQPPPQALAKPIPPNIKGSTIIHATAAQEDDELNTHQMHQQFKKNASLVRFYEQENRALKLRVQDLEQNIGINKEIIGALVDSIQNRDYRQSFELFQVELKNFMAQGERLQNDFDRLNSQLLLSEQINGQLETKEKETTKLHMEQMSKLSDGIEAKEYQKQLVDSRNRDLEAFLLEIAEYDEYVRSKLEDLQIYKSVATHHVPDQIQQVGKIHNVIHENKALKDELFKSQQEVQELRKLYASLNDLKRNLRGQQVSQTDFQILNDLISKNKQNIQQQTNRVGGENGGAGVESSGNDMDNQLPSVKLFKRMTILKREKNELELQNAQLSQRVQELDFMNEELLRQIRQAEEKIETYDQIMANSSKQICSCQQMTVQQQLRTGAVVGIGQQMLLKSTPLHKVLTVNRLTSGKNIDHQQHRRRISLDPHFLAEATPEQFIALKENLVQGRLDEQKEGLVIIESESSNANENISDHSSLSQAVGQI